MKNEYSKPSAALSGETVSFKALLLCLLPVLAIFGTMMMNTYQNNFFLLCMIIIIALLVLCVAFGKVLPTALYPLAVGMISLSLVLHRSLISNYITGFDIWREYYFFRQTATLGFWNPSMPDQYSGMLSITVLPVVYSSILSLDGMWIFKVVFQLIYSLVPVVLYIIYKKQIGPTGGFLASFLFMSVQTFYTEMTQLGREEIAELFFVLLIWLIVSRRAPRGRTAVGLASILSIAIVVSHYGISYFLVLVLPTIFLFSPLLERLRLGEKKRQSTQFHKPDDTSEQADGTNSRLISPAFVLLFALLTFSWYIYTTASRTFEVFVWSLQRIVVSSLSGLFGVNQVFDVLAKPSVSVFHDLTRMSYLLIEFLILLGAVGYLTKRCKIKANRDFAALSLAFLVIMVSAVVLPYLSNQLDVARTYHVCLLLLAPFCVVGFSILWSTLERTIRERRIKNMKPSYTNSEQTRGMKLLAVVLIVFFLLNIEFFQAIAGAPHQTSISLGGELPRYPYYDQADVAGATWLFDNRKGSTKVFADPYSVEVLLGYISDDSAIGLGSSEGPDPGHLPTKGCIYLSHGNLMTRQVAWWSSAYHVEFVDLDNLDLSVHMSKTYSAGYSEVYCAVTP